MRFALRFDTNRLSITFIASFPLGLWISCIGNRQQKGIIPVSIFPSIFLSMPYSLALLIPHSLSSPLYFYFACLSICSLFFSLSTSLSLSLSLSPLSFSLSLSLFSLSLSLFQLTFLFRCLPAALSLPVIVVFKSLFTSKTLLFFSPTHSHPLHFFFCLSPSSSASHAVIVSIEGFQHARPLSLHSVRSTA